MIVRPAPVARPPFRPASSGVHSCPVALACAALPPMLAISRRLAISIDAKPRQAFFMANLLPWVTVLFLEGGHHSRQTRGWAVGTRLGIGQRATHSSREARVEHHLPRREKSGQDVRALRRCPGLPFTRLQSLHRRRYPTFGAGSCAVAVAVAANGQSPAGLRIFPC